MTTNEQRFACGVCETGYLLTGSHGRVCPHCNAYFPDKFVQDIAEQWETAKENDVEPDATDLLHELERYERLTWDSCE